MSSASSGVPPARPWVWSAAQTLTSVPSRGERLSTTQPDPPPSALPMATNSARHLAIDPKSRVIASASAPLGSPPPPSPSASK